MAELTTNQKIASASAVLILASILGHILSLGKEVLAANYFGIAGVMDAFYAAATLPNLVNNVILSTFSAIFIPIFIKHTLKNKEEANRIASILTNYLFLFLLAIAILLFVFAPWIIRYGFHGFKPETMILAIKILRIVCFSLILTGLIGIMTGILNAYKHFAWPAFSQMLITIVTVLFILFFVKQWGVFVLVYGLLAGLILQFLFLIPITKKKGYRHYFDFNLKHSALKGMLSLSLIFFIAILASQLNVVVDKIMASYLDQGSIAALGYAGKLVQVPLIIFSSSVATAVFPFFSSQVTEGKIEEMKDTLANSIRMSGFVFIPTTVMLVILAKPIIQLLFQRGVFTQEATNLTSIIFICYSFQLLFYAVGIILTRIFLAFQDVMILLKLTIVSVIMNAILNFIFIKIINPPAAGLALSTSAIYFIIMMLELFILKKKMIFLHGKYILDGLIKISVSSIVMGLGVFLMLSLCLNRIDSSSIINQIIRLCVAGIAGIIIFTGLSFLFRIKEINKLGKMIYNKNGIHKL